MRILYLHPAGTFGGAAKSLIELYRQLAAHGVGGIVLTPAGSSAEAFEDAGMMVSKVRGLSQFDNTRYGRYRGLRWLILLRELWLLPVSLWGLWRLRHERVDLIHVNEITLLFLGLLAKRIWQVPLVMHVRSLQCSPGSSWRTRRIHAWLRQHADAVVAIDHTVAATLGPDLPLHVVHNGLAVQPGNGSSARVPDGVVRVGFLGVLVPLKGVFELVEAIRLLRDRGVAVACLVAGENARHLSGLKAWLLARFGFARDVRAELEAFIERERLQDRVSLLGFVADVRSIYEQLDILCFPSHLDAAGRPVFEAAFHGVPSVVAINKPLPDAVVDGVTGLAVPAPDPVLIADALERLVRDPALRHRLGVQARRWADETFSIEANAARMAAIYRSLLAAPENR